MTNVLLLLLLIVLALSAVWIMGYGTTAAINRFTADRPFTHRKDRTT